MAYTGQQNSPKSNLPKPTDSSRLADTPEFTADLVNAIDGKVLRYFASVSARDTAFTSPVDGDCAVLPGEFHIRAGGTWKILYLSPARVHSGTTAPSSSLGSSGDIYIQY